MQNSQKAWFYIATNLFQLCETVFSCTFFLGANTFRYFTFLIAIVGQPCFLLLAHDDVTNNFRVGVL